MNFSDKEEIGSLCHELLDLRRDKSRPIVFVTGLSGSGKTTLSSVLHEVEKKIIVVSFDWWIIDPSPVRRAKIVSDYQNTGDIPDPLTWYDWHKFHLDMKVLQKTGRLDFQHAWNQSTGERDLDISLSLESDCVIVVEGMYLFEDLTNDLADYVIMIEPDIEKATKKSQARHSGRNPGDYLAIKERWHREYDVPYLQKHSDKVHLLLSNDH